MKYTCTKCGVEKDETEFHWRSDQNRPRSQCKSCINARNLSAYHNNPETRNSHRRAARKFNLKRYGLTPLDFERMYAEQSGRCAICDTSVGSLDDPETHAYVDHCHTSLKVRALLCRPCNSGLGHFFDNPAFLRAAAAYVEKHASNNI